jgi:hypothetical protein
MRTRPILAAALAASLATACAAPKKEEVLNRPPAFDPVRATGGAPQVDATELSDDPAVRRKEVLAGCYASTLMRGQVVSAGARTHVALLSASVSRGLLTARFAPPTHGDADMFEGCVANAIESGLFSIPDRGVFVTHAVEATRTPTNQGEITDVANMPRRVGGVPKDAWESAYLREADSIKGCADVTLSTSPSPDFGVLIELDVPPTGQGGTARVHSTWRDVPATFRECVRSSAERLSFPVSRSSGDRVVRYVVTYPARN